MRNIKFLLVDNLDDLVKNFVFVMKLKYQINKFVKYQIALIAVTVR